MPHLLSVWPSVSRRITGAERVLALFDFDGTLAPIVDRPELAALPPRTREHLSGLTERYRFIAGVVSGRGLEDVSTKVGIPGLVYSGNHGFEMAGPGFSFVHPQAGQLREVQRELFQELAESLADIPGVLVEDKGLTLSVHYRLTPEGLAPDLRRRFQNLVKPYVDSGALRTASGKMVLEVRPNLDWGKGRAIAELQRRFPDETLTMFFGDDATDEDGFAVVQEGDGIAVFVGAARQPTTALYRVDSPAEVGEVLGLLNEL